MNIFYSNNINKSNKRIIILDQENSHLIKVLRKKLKDLTASDNIKTYVPKINYSTDNAAMIGINGYFKFIESKFGELSDFSISKYPMK